MAGDESRNSHAPVDSSTRSNRELWVLMSGKSVLKSEQLLGIELQNASEKLLNGILHYKQPSAQSSKALAQDKNIDGAQLEFLTKLSKLLGLCEVQCFDIFCSYLIHEWKGSMKEILQNFANDRLMQTVMLQIWNYYWCERSYLLISLKHIVNYWHDETHPHHEAYKSLFELMDDNGKLIKRVTEQFEAVHSASIPVKDTHGVLMTDTQIARWTIYNLKEQCELLQIMLLYYKNHKCSPEMFVKLLELFQKHGFGRRQKYKHLIDDQNEALAAVVSYLEVLIIIQNLDLDTLSKENENVDYYLKKDDDKFKEIDRIMCSLGLVVEETPVLLAWILVRFTFIKDSTTKRLYKLVLQHDVMGYILKMITHPFLAGQVVANLVNGIIYKMISLVLLFFELGSVGKIEDLNEIAEQLLQYPEIAQDTWDKSVEFGLGILIQHAIELFPYRVSFLVKLMSSVASCSKVGQRRVQTFFMKLPSYTEPVNSLEQRASLSPGEEENSWILNSAHHPYSSDTFAIARGTKGNLVHFKEKLNTALMKWKYVTNGWQICLLEIQVFTQNIAYGTDGNVAKILDITNLVYSMIKSDVHSYDLFQQLLDSLQIIWQRLFVIPQPPIKFLAKYLGILALMAKERPKEVWRILSQSGIMPALNRVSLDITKLSSGIDLNFGSFGSIIAMHECVKGDYSLTLAFLELVSNSAEEMSQLNDSNFLASELFIFQEILPFYHKWRYRHLKDRTSIAQGCMDIIHKLLNVTKMDPGRLLATEVCVHVMLHSRAGEALLLIVATGEDNIKIALEQQLNFSPNMGDDLIALVRLSLSVLNRLLLMKRTLSKADKNSHELSPLEQFLCSPPLNRTQPHVVLIVAHYGFHYYDPRLATLAVKLLKRFAKELSISLMACLGNDAEVIRDTYLRRFETAIEDVQLKIAILEFLTVCVDVQPGLLEMFINAPMQKSPHKELSKDQPSCLQSVMDILKERQEAVHFCPVELHCVAVEFLHALWREWRNMAMFVLKKDPHFWTNLCDPLFEDCKSGKSIEVAAHVLRILALELHYTELSASNLEEEFSTNLRKLTSDKNIFMWSRMVKETLEGLDRVLDESLGVMLTSEDVNEAVLLLRSWRDFLIIITKHKQFLNNKQKQHLVKDLMDLLLEQSQTLHSPKLLGLLAEFILLLMCNWKIGCIHDFAKWADNIGTLLMCVSTNQEPLTARTLLAVVSIATVYLQLLFSDESNAQDCTSLASWVVPVCTLISISTLELQEMTNETSSSVHSQFMMLCISLLKELICHLETSSLWLPALLQNSTIAGLLSIMEFSMQQRKRPELVSVILIFLVNLSLFAESAQIMNSDHLMQHLCLPLSYTYFNNDYLKEFDNEIVTLKHKESPWSQVYLNALKLVTSMLKMQGHFFFDDALNFVGVHMEQLLVTLMHIRVSLNVEDLNGVAVTLHFVKQLACYKQQWRMQHQHSYTILLSAVCQVCQASVAFLIRPNFIQHILDHKPKRNGPTALDEERQRIRRLSSTEDVEKPSPQLLKIQTKLLEIIMISLSILRYFTPDLCEILLDQNLDALHWEPILGCSFNTPTIDQDLPLNFGSMISCISICLKALTKNERAPSPGKTIQNEPSLQVDRHLLLFVLENSLMVLLSQAMLYQLLPSLTSRDKQLMKHELGTELNSFALTMNRYLRRGTTHSSSVPPAPSPGGINRGTSSPGNQPFVKLVTTLVDKLFK